CRVHKVGRLTIEHAAGDRLRHRSRRSPRRSIFLARGSSSAAGRETIGPATVNYLTAAVTYISSGIGVRRTDLRKRILTHLRDITLSGTDLVRRLDRRRHDVLDELLANIDVRLLFRLLLRLWRWRLVGRRWWRNERCQFKVATFYTKPVGEQVA